MNPKFYSWHMVRFGGGVHESPLWLLDYIYLEYFDTNELLLLLLATAEGQLISWLTGRQNRKQKEGRRLYSLQFLAYMYKRNWHLNNLDTNWSALAGDQPQNIISPGSVDPYPKTDPDPDLDPAKKGRIHGSGSNTLTFLKVENPSTGSKSCAIQAKLRTFCKFITIWFNLCKKIKMSQF